MNKILVRSLSNYASKYNVTKMKGILVKEFGGPEVCQFKTDIPIPEPNDDQVQIRVYAAGVNPIDTYIRSGKHPIVIPKLPYTPGTDSAGVISKLGKNVKNFKIGDRVFTTESESGTYAQFAVSKPTTIFKLEDSLSFEQGSGIGVPYFSAYKSLFTKGNAKPGETVLVHGASGAVGIASIQLAKMHGMRVIGTAGTADGINLIKSQGADFAFNHREANYMEKIKSLCPEGVDIILEMLANVNLNNDLQVLKPKIGRVAIIGSRGPIEILPRYMMLMETSVFGIFIFSSDTEELNMMNEHLTALFKSQAIKPLTGNTYKLEETSKAHHDIINNSGTTGKIVLTID